MNYILSDHRSPEKDKAMDIMTDFNPTLSNKQEVEIIDLIQEIYQRNGWREFYESAARYGLHHPLDHLLENTPGDLGPLQSYLLLCSISDYNQRTDTLVSHLLEMGAYSNNSIAMNQVKTKGGRSIYFLMPLLGSFFRQSILNV